MISTRFSRRFAYVRSVKGSADEASDAGVTPQAPHLQPPKKAHRQVTKSFPQRAGEPRSEKHRIILCAPTAAPMNVLSKCPDTYPKCADGAREARHRLANIFTRHGLSNHQRARNVRRRRDQSAQRADWKRASFFGFEHAGSCLRQCLVGKQPRSQSRGTCFVLKTSHGSSQVIVSVGYQEKHHLHLFYLIVLGGPSLAPSQPPSK